MKIGKEAVETLWNEFGDCPVNDMEETLESFCGWPVFTDREEIWRWFDEQYALYGGVHALMFPDEHRGSEYGRVMADVKLQAWHGDDAITLETIRFDCGRALDALPIEKVSRLDPGKADRDTDEIFAQAVIMSLAKDHDGPFDCHIHDQDELDAYIMKRQEAEAAERKPQDGSSGKSAAKTDNAHCPVCRSANCEGSHIEVDTNYCWQPCWCNECGSQWNDLYRFDDCEDIEEHVRTV